MFSKFAIFQASCPQVMLGYLHKNQTLVEYNDSIMILHYEAVCHIIDNLQIISHKTKPNKQPKIKEKKKKLDHHSYQIKFMNDTMNLPKCPSQQEIKFPS
jgi:hypothetical protein